MYSRKALIVTYCKSCALVKGNSPEVVVHRWDKPQSNWERIHIDYADPFEDHYFVICVDAKSKWAEVKVFQ